jgi:hypothetical protein
MRFLLALFLICLSPLCADEKSLSDIDTQIAQVQEQIEIHKNRALLAERDAQRVLFQDYTQYRRFTLIQERNLDIVDELTQQLEILQKEREQVVEAQHSK